MVTCHKCAAPLGRGTQKHTKCQKCGLLYHATDCGGRYASCPEIVTPLEDCPKVWVPSLTRNFLSSSSTHHVCHFFRPERIKSFTRTSVLHQKKKTAAFCVPRRPHSPSFPSHASQCHKVCACSGGPLLCHVGRLRIRRKNAKAASLDARRLGALGGAPHVGTSLGAKLGLGAFGNVGGAAGRGFPGISGGGTSFAHTYAPGARQSDLAALAGLGGLGGFGSGLGGLCGLGWLCRW